jgi:hypothetical protein
MVTTTCGEDNTASSKVLHLLKAVLGYEQPVLSSVQGEDSRPTATYNPADFLVPLPN